MDITEADIAGLGRKLMALDLTEGEQILLERMMGADTDAEVSGFAMNDPFAGHSLIATRHATPTAFPGSGREGAAPYGFAESGKKGEAE